jgi:FKBP-type peptidyl-prolyl cis-trans isomerase
MPTPTGGEFFDVSRATTTADGLMYIDEAVGTGETPTADQSVTINYTGKLASNGQVFDSTTGRGPATFPLGRVISGFKEGILTMKVGGKRTVYIPANLGYADRPPAGSGIPVNADLIFEIELLSIK